MTWQDLLLFTPALIGVAVAWLVAWRVSKTGSAAVASAAKAPEAAAPTHGNALAGH